MHCAEGIPELDSNTLLDCLNDPEQAYPALYNMAVNTIDHPGTPTILVNGGASPLSGFWDNARPQMFVKLTLDLIYLQLVQV